ncbi:hypothetical protein GCM10009552_40510 [Rothia nasimurium]|uniref:DUF2147 domain-containing protein n=1 Tax=Luteibacter anthropi TaxID=564369 RepID=A0A7X5U7V1_9GAMM|nr:hypothetical protein [Luteibacter anthropi]NII05503.1 hypothetical protein [Luteibacter anthropi]
MTKLPLAASIVVASLLFCSAVFASDLPGRWNLSVENPDHKVVTTLKVEFTDRKATSCMGGEWKALKIISLTTQDKHFFPVSDPLSYRIENGKLTIGRNEICDAYLWLKGPLIGASVEGAYFSLGLEGSTPLGYFNLNQAR